jgi:RNA polymerase sigma factor (sigma-70 family)
MFRNKRVHVDQFKAADSDKLEIYSEINLEDQYEELEIKELVMKELNSMPVEQREVFLLKEYGGFNYKEIAEMMGISLELVKSRLHKTREKLIKRMSKIII